MHDKRQSNTPYYYQPQQRKFQSQYPLTRPYFSDRRYQYKAFRNAGKANPLMKSPQSTFAASSYSQTMKPQPQGQYISFYYPQRTRYRDWSRKVFEANAYARKWQIAQQQKHLLRNQKVNQGGAEIKLFVAGVNPTGNVQAQWIDHNRFPKQNDQNNQNTAVANSNTLPPGSAKSFQTSFSPVAAPSMNSDLPNHKPTLPKLQPQLITNRPSHNANQVSSTQGKASSITPNANSGLVSVGVKNQSLQPNAQTNSLFDKASTAKSNLNQAILSDNLGGAVLGPNAHSLLQSDTLQETPWSGTNGNSHAGMRAPGQHKANSLQNYAPHIPGPNANTNLQNKNIPGQGQDKNSNNQNLAGSKGAVNVQSNSLNSLPQNNLAHSSPNANLSPNRGQELMKSQVKTAQPSESLALGAAHMEKSTPQTFNGGLVSEPASRPESQVGLSPPSPPNATPTKKNLASRNGAPVNTNPNQTPLDREMALKNILFPPPTATKNQAMQSAPGQMVPSFPAFRYDANHPETGQIGLNNYRKNNIPRVNSRKSLVSQHNPVPYKSSFPLMLHKISPYFKMRRNLKQTSSGQARARRRFLELQRKC